MRQAIEEGFILDVLKNYTTYKMAFQPRRTAGRTTTQETVDEVRGDEGSMRWVQLHPYNIGQKVEIIVEHFRANVAPLWTGKPRRWS